MQAPLTAVARRSRPVDSLKPFLEPIRCALVSRPTQAQKQKRAILRYFVIGIALVAVVFLMAIAVYYTQGNSVTIHRVGLLAPHGALRS
jgi:formate hydrogenlyase subunit 3/multisubunit Na+/H+ antiporter MnhD subunit